MLLWGWSPVSENHAKMVFSLGWLIPALMIFCLLVLGGLLRL